MKTNDLIREAVLLMRQYKATLPDKIYSDKFLPIIQSLEQKVIDDELISLKKRKIENDTIQQKKDQNAIQKEKENDTVPQKYELDTIPSKLYSFEDDLLQKRTTKCKMHPKAPHGFLEELSRNLGRYVCRCEFWDETLERK